nr:TAL effector repeat array acceptor [Cloning vector pXtale]
MEPIRSRTPSTARELQAGSQPDAVQPIADRLVSTPASSPLDGLPARRMVSRTSPPPSPARSPAFSAGSLSGLLRQQIDPSLFAGSPFDSLPSFGAARAESAPGEGDEVQSALRAVDDPQPSASAAITAAPPRTKAAARRRSAQTSDALPAAHVDLGTFGYSQQQQEKIKPKVRSTVAQHHEALVGHGFTHAHIVELSKHPPALGTIAARYSEMIAALPEATHEDIVGVGKQKSGARALEALLTVAEELRAPPLQLVTGQLLKIAKRGGVNAVEVRPASSSTRVSPDPALAALTNDRLVALACLGGRPALDAVKKGLPHAPALVTRTHNRVPEGTAHLVADHAQVVRVLGFFQCHSHPAQAFHEAMTRFEMSREGLLQLFRRVGVTELEAISGTLPPASQRWHRILQALGVKGAKPSSASAQTPSQESVDAFADSLERELDAPSPIHEADRARASNRKRSRSESSVNRSSAQQAAEVFVPEQRDAPPLLPLSSWGVKRQRTRIGGLPDPGMPTDGELAASSAAFLEQDADPFAGAAEDFPVFDQEEIAWLMTLLPH